MAKETRIKLDNKINRLRQKIKSAFTKESLTEEEVSVIYDYAKLVSKQIYLSFNNQKNEQRKVKR